MGLMGTIGIFVFIANQMDSWNVNPIMTKRKWVDLSKNDLPAITFCHQGNTRMAFAERLIQAANEKSPKAKLYIPSTPNIDLILWHAQLIVCAVKC